MSTAKELARERKLNLQRVRALDRIAREWRTKWRIATWACIITNVMWLFFVLWMVGD